MHIEPGLVDGSKIFLSYGTAAVALAGTAWAALAAARQDGVVRLVVHSLISALLVFCFFEVLPHYRVGVSEVHLILGSTLFLLFGPGAAAIGLAGGLLTQGLFFVPADLPQYGMNVTTLLVPLLGLSMLARRIVAPNTAYVDLRYLQTFKMSVAYQGGIVVWVAFWAIYGQGLSHVTDIVSFGASYMLVILVEPLIDLAVLAGAKGVRKLHSGAGAWLQPRMYYAE